MSRTGKKTISIPDKVKINVAQGQIVVEGPLGKLTQVLRPEVEIDIQGSTLHVQRRNDSPQSRAYHGLTRALIFNMVHGVSAGFQKELDITGVGYRAEVKGEQINFALGFSHPVEFPLPHGISAKIDKQTHIVISGFDKALVGQVAADIRRIRPPEPYKGKGVRYSKEVIRRKAGKTAGGKGGK